MLGRDHNEVHFTIANLALAYQNLGRHTDAEPLLLESLERTGWNKARAARLLGLNRTTLLEMIKKRRIKPPEAR